jgi:hypothetical protein
MPSLTLGPFTDTTNDQCNQGMRQVLTTSHRQSATDAWKG